MLIAYSVRHWPCSLLSCRCRRRLFPTCIEGSFIRLSVLSHALPAQYVSYKSNVSIHVKRFVERYSEIRSLSSVTILRVRQESMTPVLHSSREAGGHQVRWGTQQPGCRASVRWHRRDEHPSLAPAGAGASRRSSWRRCHSARKPIEVTSRLSSFGSEALGGVGCHPVAYL